MRWLHGLCHLYINQGLNWSEIESSLIVPAPEEWTVAASIDATGLFTTADPDTSKTTQGQGVI